MHLSCEFGSGTVRLAYRTDVNFDGAKNDDGSGGYVEPALFKIHTKRSFQKELSIKVLGMPIRLPSDILAYEIKFNANDASWLTGILMDQRKLVFHVVFPPEVRDMQATATTTIYTTGSLWLAFEMQKQCAINPKKVIPIWE